MGYYLHAYAPEPTLKPMVQGKRGVVAAGHPLVAEAGYRMFQQGGTAIDAGIAAVFAAGVVEQISFGLGGEAPLILKRAGEAPRAINGGGWSPRLATPDFFRTLAKDDPRRVHPFSLPDARPGTIPSYGPVVALVPGAIDALLTALQEFGTLKFADVIAPALELAQGLPVDQRLSEAIAADRQTIELWPDSARVFLPGGRVPEAGSLWAQPDLARTFELMIRAERDKSGHRAARIQAVRDCFYRGPIARAIADFCEQAGGLMRYDDLAEFRSRVEEPLTTRYRGVDVYKCSFWTQGPVMLQNLNVLAGFDLRGMGHNSPDYLHTVVEAMKLGYADRDAHYGDPEHAAIPAALLSPEYAALRRELMCDRASPAHVPGDPEQMQARASEEFVRARYRERNAEHQDTTCVNTIDAQGNMFSATPSGAWLPSVIAGDTGIPLSQRITQFVMTPGHPNQVGPRKRPRLTLTPGLALREGKPWLAWSTPGGDSQDQTLLQVLLNMVEFGMTPQQAVEAPRVNSVAMYSSFDSHLDTPLGLQAEARILAATLDALRARGHKIVSQGEWGNGSAPTAVEFDAEHGTLRAGADVRGMRVAIGW